MPIQRLIFFHKLPILRPLAQIELKVFFRSILKRTLFAIVISIVEIFIRFIELIQLVTNHAEVD